MWAAAWECVSGQHHRHAILSSMCRRRRRVPKAKVSPVRAGFQFLGSGAKVVLSVLAGGPECCCLAQSPGVLLQSGGGVREPAGGRVRLWAEFPGPGGLPVSLLVAGDLAVGVDELEVGADSEGCQGQQQHPVAVLQV